MLYFRSPSTPTVSRPHTPQTPIPYIQPSMGGPQGQHQIPPMVMTPGYMLSGQSPYQQQQQGNRYRKGIRSNKIFDIRDHLIVLLI